VQLDTQVEALDKVGLSDRRTTAGEYGVALRVAVIETTEWTVNFRTNTTIALRAAPVSPALLFANVTRTARGTASLAKVTVVADEKMLA